MTTRRGFLKGAGAAAGIAFCSCGLLDAARAQQPGRPRLPLMVNGKRVKTYRCPLPLPVPRGRQPHGRRSRGVMPPAKGAQEQLHRHRAAPRGHGRDGDRHGGALHQSVLVPQGPRHRRPNRQGAEREAGGAVRRKAGPLRRLRFARPSVSRSRRAAARGSREEAGPARRRHRRQRRWARTSPNPNSIRCGPRPRSSAPCCSFIRRARRSSPSASRAMAGCRTPSATRSTPPLPCST